MKITLTLAAYLTGWALFLVIGDSWYQTITDVIVGVTFTQVACVLAFTWRQVVRRRSRFGRSWPGRRRGCSSRCSPWRA